MGDAKQSQSRLELQWPKTLFTQAHILSPGQSATLTGVVVDSKKKDSDVQITLSFDDDVVTCLLEGVATNLVKKLSDKWQCRLSSVTPVGGAIKAENYTPEGSIEEHPETPEQSEDQEEDDDEDDDDDYEPIPPPKPKVRRKPRPRRVVNRPTEPVNVKSPPPSSDDEEQARNAAAAELSELDNSLLSALKADIGLTIAKHYKVRSKTKKNYKPKKKYVYNYPTVIVRCGGCNFQTKRSRDLLKHIHNKHPRQDDYQDLIQQCEEEMCGLSRKVYKPGKVVMECPYCKRKRLNNTIFRHLTWCHSTFEADFGKVFAEMQVKYDAALIVAKKQASFAKAGFVPLTFQDMDPDDFPVTGQEISSEPQEPPPDQESSQEKKNDEVLNSSASDSGKDKEPPANPKNPANATEPLREPEKQLMLLPNKYTCPDCNFVFTKLAHYSRHVKHACAKNPNVKPMLKCRFCGFQTRDDSVMDEHMELHKDKYVCEFCGKMFMYQSAWYQHKRRTHGVGKPVEIYKCTVCTSEFTYKSAFKSHMRIMHSGVKYPCEHCGKTFREISRLENHRRTIHFNDFRYRCPKCNYGLHTKQKLLRHVCGKTRKRSRDNVAPPDPVPEAPPLQAGQVEGWSKQMRPRKIPSPDTTTKKYPLNMDDYYRKLASEQGPQAVDFHAMYHAVAESHEQIMQAPMPEHRPEIPDPAVLNSQSQASSTDEQAYRAEAHVQNPDQGQGHNLEPHGQVHGHVINQGPPPQGQGQVQGQVQGQPLDVHRYDGHDIQQRMENHYPGVMENVIYWPWVHQTNMFG